jgi:MFS family permease
MDAIASYCSSRVRAAAGRYREARRALHAPASVRSRRGLDWMNFFIADVQTGFGTFVAFYLAQMGWAPTHIGIALSVGAVAGMLSQIPGGALADAVTWKRGLAAVGIVGTAAAALLLAISTSVASVFASQVLQGVTAGIITPMIGAISLGLVGRSAMAVRTGRNLRYAAIGHALTGVLMGAAGAYIAKSAIFAAAALLCIPALIALSFIRGDEIDYVRARNAKSAETSAEKKKAEQSPAKDAGGKATRDKAMTATSVFALAKNPALALFMAATVLFQLADASVLPMIGENLATSRGDHAALWMSGLIVVPQVVVAALAPWVGFHSEKRGRRPLLLIGFALEPLRALLLAATSVYPALVAAQFLSGVTGAIIGVLTVIVVADLTAGTGRFNLAIGVLGALGGIAASISTTVTGYIFQLLGPHLGYVPLAVVAALAAAMLWVFLAESRPEKYES